MNILDTMNDILLSWGKCGADDITRINAIKHLITQVYEGVSYLLYLCFFLLYNP